MQTIASTSVVDGQQNVSSQDGACAAEEVFKVLRPDIVREGIDRELGSGVAQWMFSSTGWLAYANLIITEGLRLAACGFRKNLWVR